MKPIEKIRISNKLKIKQMEEQKQEYIDFTNEQAKQYQPFIQEEMEQLKEKGWEIVTNIQLKN